MSAPQTYDLIGIGFGPANVAVAGAIVEKYTFGASSPRCQKRVLFIDKYPEFQWHPGMLLPDARMQISFMKDLATLRNPRSPITFLSYLHSQDRLISFINRGQTIPSRKEYADYLSWAAAYVQEQGIQVQFKHEVTGIQATSNGTIEVHSKNVQTGEEVVHFSRDLIISPGGSPYVPAPLSQVIRSTCGLHSSTYLQDIDAALSTAPTGRPIRVAVIGAGQSAAEVALNLQERLSILKHHDTPHVIDMIIRRGALRPSDDSPFANEIFDPAATGALFSYPDHTRQVVIKEYRSTNYSVVNPVTLEALYEVIYTQRVDAGISRRRSKAIPADQPRVNIIPHTHVLSAHSTQAKNGEAGCILTLQSITSNKINEVHYDVVVCATGYRRTSWIKFFTSSNLGKYFGIPQNASEVRLSPATRGLHIEASAFEAKPPRPAASVISSNSDSGVSTPLTSDTSVCSSARLATPGEPVNVHITRNYRLLPVLDNDESGFTARIYLQGLEEVTHGLSDTLLSVLGMRAGEVVADLYGNED